MVGAAYHELEQRNTMHVTYLLPEVAMLVWTTNTFFNLHHPNLAAAQRCGSRQAQSEEGQDGYRPGTHGETFDQCALRLQGP
jgi:hypothetical protein